MDEILDLHKKEEASVAIDSSPQQQSAYTLSNGDSSETPQLPRTITEHLLHERHPRVLERLQNTLLSFSPFERLLLYTLTAILSVSTLAIVISLSSSVSTQIPSHGGALSEGAIGTPRFINPLLAVSQTDQDLTALIYSGLMRPTQSGMEPDLASSFEASEDATQYTFHLREDATFHDGKPVTAADVEFTVLQAQNSDIKSPRRADWEGVQVRVENEKTVVFTLPHAYAPFLENTQLGILPKHLWEHIPVDEFPFHVLNTNPVGSGPYKMENITANDAGTPLSYSLTAFNEFVLGVPYISNIVFHFFSNEAALLESFINKEVDSFAGVSPESIPLEERADVHLVRAPSTRIFAVFLNQNHASVLADAAVRSALAQGVERDAIVESVLSGYGRPALGPIPPGLLSSRIAQTDSGTTTAPSDLARSALEDGGWKLVEPTSTSTPDEQAQWKKKDATLSFALATADTPDLVATANAVADAWRAAGIDVSVQVYPLTEFNTTVLRPRSYDAVLFGEVVGRSLDLFAFWHSSQRNDPGLNLALYANANADKILASARVEPDRSEREKLYATFVETVAEDNPAIFLYSPDFVYTVPATVQNLSLGALTSPSERFLNVHEWYTDTERVWDVFAK